MSKLEKLMGKGKEIEISGIHIDIKPLTVSSLPLLMKMSQQENPEVQAKAIQEILYKTLKDGIPDCTDKEIDNLPLEHLQKIMEAIMEVNQLEGSVNEKTFIENLKRKKDGCIGQTGDKKE